MEFFIYLLIFSIAMIIYGKSIFKSSIKEEININNKIVYTFADIQITFGRLLIIPSILGILLYELLGMIILVIVIIIIVIYLVSLILGGYKFYRNKEYKMKSNSKIVRTIIVAEVLFIIVVGVYILIILNGDDASFKMVEESENNGTKIRTYELIDLPSDESYKLSFDIINRDIEDFKVKPKYVENIGVSNVYYSIGIENPKIIFIIDKEDKCSIDVIGRDKNSQQVKYSYKFKFKRVDNELSDIITQEVDILYPSKSKFREKESSVGIYGSENNEENISIRMNISIE